MTPKKSSDRVVAKAFTVRDVDEPDLGIRTWYPADEATELELHGIGHTFSDATDEIEDRLDLDDHVGERVATVLIDLDESKSEYYIDWHVDVESGIVDNLVGATRKVLRK